MAIKTAQVFITEDNYRFDNREAAITHEVKTEALRALKSILEVSMKSARPDSMLAELLLESQAVSDVLTRYRKRMPKQKELENVS